MADEPILPSTKQIPKVVPLTSDTANTILRKLEEIAASQERTDEKLDAHINDFGIYKLQVDQRLRNNSDRYRQSSQADLDAKAELGNERAAREALAKRFDTFEEKTDAQTAILVRLDGVASKLAQNPLVKRVGQLALLCAAIWLGSWLTAHGVHP
jgi:hypothetical protein